MVAGVLLAARSASAIVLNRQDPNSIKQVASVIAHGMMSYYSGNTTGGTPGLLPGPYYWWEAGAMWGSLIDYWYYTGDATYNDVVTQAMLFQTGTDNSFMPSNQTKSEGNDDQGFWGMAAMSAAEVKFPNPPDNQPQWLELAQAVFNSQALRWDTSSCGGGLKWQIFAFNNGYNYKNSISNGAFFNLAARLGYYTKNQTYFDWANQMYDWVESVGLMSPTYQVFDGTDDNLNCSQLNHLQWTYNAGVFLLGASVMWNQTTGAEQANWEKRIRGIIAASVVFFENGIMYEVACEPQGNCDTDQLSFKAYLSRWMAASSKVAPFVIPLVSGWLQTSAAAAAASCSGGTDGVTCGTKWTVNAWDNTWGVGQQMSALEVVQGLLINGSAGPVSNLTGGISRGNPAAGTGGDGAPGAPTTAITTGDKAGAGILTAVVLVGLIGGAW
ncbi:glycoside hydrolase family 76 protein [Baudoinia panamericana UAMH 10762]|uniref:Mannan endo-1,6-alpha-mannosidase n=1 Tax=Baudoinia panamericana (strain UAMH 10762) TaxID=717646 RepID=M2N725_BAUPA|nr:glycoside hydrolase family 76 protein [Baudoinia panamericana UAMH 10762]EMC94580.1 glycoside hydrolase family 76 protein [Baudoinia panamericana UAMH 10762]